MPLLLFLSSTFTSLFSALLLFFGRKLVVAAASLAAALALTLAFIAFVNSFITSVAQSLVLPVWCEVLLWFVPTNFSVCISAIMLANIARAAYDYGMEKIKLVNAAT